jgi:hypothetical protein
MFRLVVLTCVIAASCGQFVEDKNAKIIKEQRFNAGDGRAGSAFATENELVFREETALDGSRIGQYSYIGDDGKTYTVKYSAGKEGFRILEGAHIPSGGQDAAAFVATPAPEPAAPIAEPQQPAIRARPAPAPQQIRLPAPEPQIPEYDLVEEPVDPNFNPFINPHDPTHRNFAFNKNGAKFAPKVPGVLDSSFVPPCAGCEGLNPFINPFDASHTNFQQTGLLAGHLAGAQARPAPRRPAPIANARPTGRVIAQPQQPARLPLNLATTPAPKRFFPPGQIKLNRFETGFNFDFES